MKIDQTTLLNISQDVSLRIKLSRILNSIFVGYQSYDELPDRIKSKCDKSSWDAIFKLDPDEMTPFNKLKYIMDKTGKSLTSMINEQEILLHWRGYRMEITRAEFWSSNVLEIHLYNDYGNDLRELFSESHWHRDISDLILGKEVKMGVHGSMYFCDGKGNYKPLDLKRYEVQ